MLFIERFDGGFSKLKDDGWGDNATAITGNTSVASGSMDDMSRVGAEPGRSNVAGEMSPDGGWSTGVNGGTFGGGGPSLGWSFRCQRYVGSTAAALLALFALATPIVMVILPRMNVVSSWFHIVSYCNFILPYLTPFIW